MIEARHYNLNNIIHIRNIGYCRIVGLDKLDNQIIPIVANNEKEFKVPLSAIENIELTEDLLLKCGFERLNKSFLINNGYVIHFEKNLIMCVKSGVLLSTLHQLQNLYWILVGKELEINL